MRETLKTFNSLEDETYVKRYDEGWSLSTAFNSLEDET